MYLTFLNCLHIFRHNRSAISGYYTMRAPSGSVISVYCDDNTFDNCSQIFKENSSALSGYYTMRVPNGSLIAVYCDLSFLSNCDGKRGWMRVGYLKMSVPGATCPHALTLHQYNNINHDLCSRPVSSSASVFFPCVEIFLTKMWMSCRILVWVT